MSAVLVILRPKSLTVVLAVVGLLSFIGTVPLLAALKQPGTSTSNQVDEFFIHGSLVKPERLIEVQGFQQASQGWDLAPGASGDFVYRVPGSPGTTIGINLWINAPAGVTNSVSVSAPGLPPVQLAQNLTSLGDRLELPSQYAAASSVDVRIEARNAGAVQQQVITKITTYSVTGTDPRAPPIYSFLAFGVLVGLIAYFVLRKRPHPVLVATGIGAITALGAAARIGALYTLHLPVEPDAIGYKTYGEQFQWWPLFDHGIFSGNFNEREPLFPLIVHVYFQVLGASDFHLRVVSATLSIGVIVLSIVAARRRLQTWWAPLLVGFVIAINGPLIQESYRGLRLEEETLLMLGLYLALDRGPARRPWLEAVLLGLLGAAMALARTEFILVFVAAVAVSLFFRYRSLRKVIGLVAVATLIMGGAEAAHRVGLYEHHGNVSFDTAGYMRWNANEELYRYHRPLPHIELFPTLAEYQTLGNYSGPPITSFQYLFVIHSPVEFVRDSLAGTTLIFQSMDSFIFDVRAGVAVHKFPASLAPIAKSVATRFDLLLAWTVFLGLLGMCVGAWRDRRLLIVPIIVATWIGTTAFLFDHGLLEKYRHTWQVYPLALIAGALLLEQLALYLAAKVKPGRILHVDTGLFAAALVLTPATYLTSHSLHYAAVGLLVVAVAWLCYRRPAWGTASALIAVSAGTGLAGAAAALAATAATGYRVRPPWPLWPLLTLVALGLAIVLAGGTPTSGGLEAAATLVGLVTAVTLTARTLADREQLVWLLAGIGPLAGVMYLLHPSAPGAVELAPLGVVAAAWLYLRGHRVALPLGLLDVTLVVLLTPFAAWIGVAVVVSWMAVQSGRIPRSRRLLLAGGLATALAGLTAGASLAATTPATTAAWSTRLASPAAPVTQQITVDRTGDTSLWFYARRSTELTDFPFTVLVNGSPVTTDLNSVLPTDEMTWNRVPLGFTPQTGDRLEIQVVPAGTANPVDRYLELGGVWASVSGIKSPGVNGTYLIVLGDDSMPLAPNGLPEPMVRNRLQPPMGAWMPGELSAPVESRQEAAVLTIWQQTLASATQHPFGVGTGNLGPALEAAGVGLGPGLTARSELLQALGEWGFAGAAALLLLLAVGAWLAWRAHDRLAMALLGLAAITMLGESLLAEPAGAASAWVAVAFCFGAIAPGAAAPSTSPASNGEMRPETSLPEATRVG